MDFDRLKLLEQKVEVMQREVSEVLGELHTMVQLLIKGQQVSSDAFARRIDQCEAAVEKLILRDGPKLDTREGGKEL